MPARRQPSPRLTTIDLHMQALKFSAAHFTIFNATERERLHGHNYAVTCRITAPVGDDGLTCDYAVFKQKLYDLVNHLDEYTIIARFSPYLKIEEQDVFYKVHFHDHFMLLRKTETLLLPIRNTTVEELSFYILDELTKDQSFLKKYDVRRLETTVASGPGQHGSAVWER